MNKLFQSFQQDVLRITHHKLWHSLWCVVLVSLCRSVMLCGSREQTGFLCGAQHVETCSDPFGHTAAAARLQLTRSVRAGFYPNASLHYVRKSNSLSGECDYSESWWIGLPPDATETHSGVKRCDGFSPDFKLLLTFYFSPAAGIEMLKVFTERVQDGQTEWINDEEEMSKARCMRHTESTKTRWIHCSSVNPQSVDQSSITETKLGSSWLWQTTSLRVDFIDINWNQWAYGRKEINLKTDREGHKSSLYADDVLLFLWNS